MRNDLLLAQARGNTQSQLMNYRRPMFALLESTPLSWVLDQILRQRAHMMMVVDEYGDMEGIVTLEDVLETLLGLEILDEVDRREDMQAHARRLWRRRADEMGLDVGD